MTPKKKNTSTSLSEIKYSLQGIEETQERIEADVKEALQKIYNLEIWKAKVEDTIKGTVSATDKTSLEKYGLNGTIILGLIWLIINLLSGGTKVQWPF